MTYDFFLETKVEKFCCVFDITPCFIIVPSVTRALITISVPGGDVCYMYMQGPIDECAVREYGRLCTDPHFRARR